MIAAIRASRGEFGRRALLDGCCTMHECLLSRRAAKNVTKPKPVLLRVCGVLSFNDIVCDKNDRFWPRGFVRRLLAKTVHPRTGFLGRFGVSYSVSIVPANLAAMHAKASGAPNSGRGGSVCLNSFEQFRKRISRSVTPPQGLVSAG